MTTPKSLRHIIYLDFMDGCDIYYQDSGKVILRLDEEVGMVYYILQYSPENDFIYRIGDVIGYFLGYYSYEGYEHNDTEIKMLMHGILDAFIDTLTLVIYFNNDSFYALENDAQKEIINSLYENETLFQYAKSKMDASAEKVFNSQWG